MEILVNPNGSIQIPSKFKGKSFERRRQAKKDILIKAKQKAKEENRIIITKI